MATSRLVLSPPPGSDGASRRASVRLVARVQRGRTRDAVATAFLASMRALLATADPDTAAAAAAAVQAVLALRHAGAAAAPAPACAGASTSETVAAPSPGSRAGAAAAPAPACAGASTSETVAAPSPGSRAGAGDSGLKMSRLAMFGSRAGQPPRPGEALTVSVTLSVLPQQWERLEPGVSDSGLIALGEEWRAIGGSPAKVYFKSLEYGRAWFQLHDLPCWATATGVSAALTAAGHDVLACQPRYNTLGMPFAGEFLACLSLAKGRPMQQLSLVSGLNNTTLGSARCFRVDQRDDLARQTALHAALSGSGAAPLGAESPIDAQQRDWLHQQQLAMQHARVQQQQRQQKQKPQQEQQPSATQPQAPPQQPPPGGWPPPPPAAQPASTPPTTTPASPAQQAPQQQSQPRHQPPAGAGQLPCKGAQQPPCSEDSDSPPMVSRRGRPPPVAAVPAEAVAAASAAMPACDEPDAVMAEAAAAEQAAEESDMELDATVRKRDRSPAASAATDGPTTRARSSQSAAERKAREGPRKRADTGALGAAAPAPVAAAPAASAAAAATLQLDAAQQSVEPPPPPPDAPPQPSAT